MFFHPEQNRVPEELQNQILKFRKLIQKLKDSGVDPGNLAEVDVDELRFKDLKIFVAYEVFCKKYLGKLNEETNNDVIAEMLGVVSNLQIQNPKSGFHGFINNRLTVITGNLSMRSDYSLEEKRECLKDLKELLQDFKSTEVSSEN